MARQAVRPGYHAIWVSVHIGVPNQTVGTSPETMEPFASTVTLHWA